MLIDIDALMMPLADGNGAGPDLSYDPDRQSIEQAFDTSISEDAAGTEVDWRKVVAQVTEQATRTKDVWLAVYLMRAGAKGGDISLVEAGSAYLAGLFEFWWPSVHPTIDDYGFQGRKGPCESLTRVSEFLGPLRRVSLISHPRLGSFSTDDFERFREGGEAVEGYGMFRAAIAETPDDVLQAEIARIDRIHGAIVRVDEVLTAHADDDTGTNFSTTYATLDAMRRGLATYATVTVEAGVDADNLAPSSLGGTSPMARDGAINSRDGVMAAIEAICDYYRRCEPASPVPLALRRAGEWVNLDFLAVLGDIAPESLAEARRVLSFRRDDNESSFE